MGKISFKNISKAYNQKSILKKININIQEGELFTFLGPSGCGKTTLLRILAGFEMPDSGTVEINGEDITTDSPEQRRISMVFQSYALFPHMNVYGNVSYGLKIRGFKDQDIKEKVEHLLKMVKLQDFMKRDVNELSGGEQQRVAIARALAVDPKVLLLDEPLSNLDAKLREKTRLEIRELQQELAITTIFVTHDQHEAMSISDRIAVFNDGNINQTGSPLNIYNHPEDEFVAGFIGESNIIARENYSAFKLRNIDAPKVCLRPQDFNISEDGDIEAEVMTTEFRGSSLNYHCLVGTVKIKVLQINDGEGKKILPGETLKLKVKDKAVKKLR